MLIYEVGTRGLVISEGGYALQLFNKNMARYRLGACHGSLTNTLLDIQL